MPPDPFRAYVTGLPQEEGRVYLVPMPYRGRLALAPESLAFIKHQRARGGGEEIIVPANAAALPVADLRGDTWFLGALLVFATSDAARDAGFGVIINLVSSYIYDRLKRMLPRNTPEVRLKIFHRNSEEIFEFQYSGPADELARLEVSRIVSKLRPIAANETPAAELALDTGSDRSLLALPTEGGANDGQQKGSPRARSKTERVPPSAEKQTSPRSHGRSPKRGSRAK